MDAANDLPFWPRPNRFLASLRDPLAKMPSFVWVSLNSPEIVEIIGTWGITAVVLDMEHSSTGFGDIQRLATAADASGTTPLARICEGETGIVGRLLDLGVQGIVFPRVSTGAEARAAAGSARFPPEGNRGWAGAHARFVRWTGSMPNGGPSQQLLSRDFTDAVNEATAIIFMIEDVAGAEAIDEILDARPDGVIFGGGDFALSCDMDAERVAWGRRTVTDACRARGIGVAISVSPPDLTEPYPGCFLSAGVDATLVSLALSHRASEAGTLAERHAPGARNGD